MLDKWVSTKLIYPPLLINSSGYKMSYKVLVYREEWERIDIAWVVMNPAGDKHWRTETETDIMLDEIDYWMELPKIPN